MKNFRKCVLLIVMLSMILTGCSSKPPSADTVEKHFENNYNDIQKVIEFMINSKYTSISIQKTDGTMWADFETVPIEDEDVCNAINRLIDLSSNGRQYYSIYKSENTITFEQWKGMADIGCGIAYSINGTDWPQVEFATELVPLSQPGWYYYVDDYNAWRTGKRPWQHNSSLP